MTDDDAGESDLDLVAIDRIRRGEAVVVSVTGEVDVASGPPLRTALGEALDEPGPGPVVADLSGVTFLGSTGVAVLVDVDWQAKQRDKPFRLVVNRTGAVLRTLTATGVDGLLAIHHDLDAALQAGPDAPR
jgi:anti-sigma B factor antagonist